MTRPPRMPDFDPENPVASHHALNQWEAMMRKPGADPQIAPMRASHVDQYEASIDPGIIERCDGVAQCGRRCTATPGHRRECLHLDHEAAHWARQPMPKGCARGPSGCRRRWAPQKGSGIDHAPDCPNKRRD